MPLVTLAHCNAVLNVHRKLLLCYYIVNCTLCYHLQCEGFGETKVRLIGKALLAEITSFVAAKSIALRAFPVPQVATALSSRVAAAGGSSSTSNQWDDLEVLSQGVLQEVSSFHCTLRSNLHCANADVLHCHIVTLCKRRDTALD